MEHIYDCRPFYSPRSLFLGRPERPEGPSKRVRDNYDERFREASKYFALTSNAIL